MHFGFIDIILLAMFAGFIILRLRNILGRKTGHQEKPMSKYFPKGMEVLKDIKNNEEIISNFPQGIRIEVGTPGLDSNLEKIFYNLNLD